MTRHPLGKDVSLLNLHVSHWLQIVFRMYGVMAYEAIFVYHIAPLTVTGDLVYST